MTNSQRFLDAYNMADKALHNRFGFKLSMSYSDAVRRAAAFNAVVRKFEDDLLDYGRLRNAIVHRSNSLQTIAEPHDDVTERFEFLAKLLATPPKASTIAKKAAVVDVGQKLLDCMLTMSGKGYSNLPVTEGDRIIGVLTNKSIVGFLAAHAGDIDNVLTYSCVKDALGDSKEYYTIKPDCPVDEILAEFESNRRLLMIIITSDGTAAGQIIGVITVGDLITINKMLDPF